MNSSASTSALILIAVAIAGAGVSYHFTLESRFNAIEQKLEQNSLALQQYQIAQDTLVTSKTEALNSLSKEVDSLQASLAPLGKATHEQTDSLAEIRKQVTSLQQSQQAQEDAQKKLSEYASALEKAKAPSTPVSVPIPATAPAPAPAPVAAPTPTAAAPVSVPATQPQPVTSHASTLRVSLPVTPKVDNAVDLRPAETTLADATPVRALPVALPVELSQK